MSKEVVETAPCENEKHLREPKERLTTFWLQKNFVNLKSKTFVKEHTITHKFWEKMQVHTTKNHWDIKLPKIEVKRS